MAAVVNDHQAGNKLDVNDENGHFIAEDFDYTEEMESQFVNLDADTEQLDISNFVGDLRALMVDDSEDDEIVLDSDDEILTEQKEGKIRGSLWRRVSSQSFEIRSSAGSNLTDKKSDNNNNPNTHFQESLVAKSNLISNNEISIIKSPHDNFETENEAVIGSPEPGESSQANALKFVDHFLSVSIVNSSPEPKIPKTVGKRSPFSSCAKGSQNLAVKNNLMSKIGISTFDWDEKSEDGLQELPTSGNGENEKNVQDMFDGVFDTQMAAEAIESLLYAPVPTFDANNKCDLQNDGIFLNQKSTEKKLKVFSRKKKKKELNKKVNTFSPVACRTRNGSSVEHSKMPEETTNCDFKNNIHKRKTGDLYTNFGYKFDTWNWPKKKRTCRKLRQNVKSKSTINSAIVGPGETEVFFMSNVKRKARSATKYKSKSKSTFVKKFGQPCLADVTNTKKMKELLLGENKLIKKKSLSPSLSNEHVRLGFKEYFPDFISKDLRRRRNKAEIRVLFSQNLDDEVINQQKKIMTKLGILMAKDCSDATHFVSDRFARTKKMLETMAFGKPVITPLWLESCEQANTIIDEKSYILRDFKREKELGFSMPVSLSRARTHPLFKDQRVLITPNVKPDKEIIGNLVKAVHGQVIEDIKQATTEYKISDNILILSCEQDYETCVPFLDKGAAVYSSELLLNGIIIQKLEYTRHQLFNGHVIMKRYARNGKKNGSQSLHGG